MSDTLLCTIPNDLYNVILKSAPTAMFVVINIHRHKFSPVELPSGYKPLPESVLHRARYTSSYFNFAASSRLVEVIQ